MKKSAQLLTGIHSRNLDSRKRLTMATLDLVTFTTILLENDLFFAQATCDHRSLNRGAGNKRRADYKRITRANCQYLIEEDRRAVFGVREFLHVEFITRLNPVLLSACPNYSVHLLLLRCFILSQRKRASNLHPADFKPTSALYFLSIINSGFSV